MRNGRASRGSWGAFAREARHSPQVNGPACWSPENAFTNDPVKSPATCGRIACAVETSTSPTDRHPVRPVVMEGHPGGRPVQTVATSERRQVAGPRTLKHNFRLHDRGWRTNLAQEPNPRLPGRGGQGVRRCSPCQELRRGPVFAGLVLWTGAEQAGFRLPRRWSAGQARLQNVSRKAVTMAETSSRARW